MIDDETGAQAAIDDAIGARATIDDETGAQAAIDDETGAQVVIDDETGAQAAIDDEIGARATIARTAQAAARASPGRSGVDRIARRAAARLPTRRTPATIQATTAALGTSTNVARRTPRRRTSTSTSIAYVTELQARVWFPGYLIGVLVLRTRRRTSTRSIRRWTLPRVWQLGRSSVRIECPHRSDALQSTCISRTRDSIPTIYRSIKGL